MSPLTIRPYDPRRDEAWTYALWQRSLGQVWPLSQATFHHVTVANAAYQAGDHAVAQIGARRVGFVASQMREIPGEQAPLGQVTLLLVEPRYQRRGIGRTLLDHALAGLQQRGVAKVQLGGGGLAYFWAGVPANLPAAWAFFQACGWAATEQSFDLMRPLRDYTTPPEIYARIRCPNIRIETAMPADREAVLEFEAHHFPRWLYYYQQVMQRGGYAAVVLARDAREGIVGTSSVMDSRTMRHTFVWEQLLAAPVGGVGPLGVAEHVRGNGIGLALAARVTERLHERGVVTSYIGWTWLVDWYGKLGYQIWQSYTISWKQLRTVL